MENTDLIKALVKAQAELTGAKKDSTNPHFKSHYPSLASVIDAVKGPLNKNGIAFVQSPFNAGEGRIGLETHLIHTSGQELVSHTITPLSKQTPQGVGDALTYLRRYSLMAMTGIAPMDDDGESNERRDVDSQDRAEARAEGARDFPKEGKKPTGGGQKKDFGDYDPTGDQRPVTEKQLGRLFAKSRAINATKEEMSEFLQLTCAVDSSKDLNREQIDKVFKLMETFEKAGDEAHTIFSEFILFQGQDAE